MLLCYVLWFWYVFILKHKIHVAALLLWSVQVLRKVQVFKF